jgi:hypothetical protein
MVIPLVLLQLPMMSIIFVHEGISAFCLDDAVYYPCKV